MPIFSTSMKINGDETTHQVIALGTGSSPDRNPLTIFRIGRGSPTFTKCRTTNPAADAGSAWDLRHHTDPEHAPAFRHPVIGDPSGDPTIKFQTGSMIRLELMSYQRTESVRDNRPRRGYIIHTRSQIPHRSLANPCISPPAQDPGSSPG